MHFEHKTLSIFHSINGVSHRSLTSYEAPEQYSGEITTRSDIYGLGATFYSLLTGIVPTDALSRESKSSDPLKSVNQLVPGISTLVAECIDCAMSLSCDDRFPTVEQFRQALKADPAWQQSQRLNLRRVLELDLALKGDSSWEPSSKYSIEFPTPSQPQADTLEQESPTPLLMPLPLVDQPLPEAETTIPDTPDQQPLEPVNASFAPDDQQLSVDALNGMVLLTPGALSPPQISHYDYSHLWPEGDIEMSFSQSGCEWFVRTQE